MVTSTFQTGYRFHTTFTVHGDLANWILNEFYNYGNRFLFVSSFTLTIVPIFEGGFLQAFIPLSLNLMEVRYKTVLIYNISCTESHKMDTHNALLTCNMLHCTLHCKHNGVGFWWNIYCNPDKQECKKFEFWCHKILLYIFYFDYISDTNQTTADILTNWLVDWYFHNQTRVILDTIFKNAKLQNI